VLKPGGRLAVSDIVVRGEMPSDIRRRVELWARCVAGALEDQEYVSKLARSGFENLEVEPTRVYKAADAKDLLASLGTEGDRIAAAVEGKFASAFIRARQRARV
jgi:arsenite methyltransferase